MNISEFNVYGKISRTPIIYVAVLSCVTIILIALPFLRISVEVQTTGLIRPATRSYEIRSSTTGKIKESFVQENEKVKKGQLLFQIENEVNDVKEKYLTTKIRDYTVSLTDLQILIKRNSTIAQLKTSLYRQAYIHHEQKRNEILTHLQKVNSDYNRNKKLYEQKVISDSEFEMFQFELNKASDNLFTLDEDQLNHWETEIWSTRKELKDYESQLAQLQREKNYMNIKAPVSGSLQNMTVLFKGTPIFSNQELGQISPDTSLIVEAHVSPHDIGLLKENMSARFTVDAFHHNQWGIASGKIIEVAHDIKIVDNTPYFEVRCSLNKEFLQLKNGYKGLLKKGMTLHAHFIITERSLWQLLDDKVDNWMNPNN